MFLSRLVPLPASRVGQTGRLSLARWCLISGYFCIFPVGSGIEHFSRNNATVLRFPACLPGGDVIGFVFFLSAPRLGFPAAHAVSARVMSSVSAVCLLALSDDVIHRRHSLRLSSVRPSSSRCLAPLVVSWDGEPTGLFACLMMSLPVVWRWRRGHAFDVERCRGSFAVPLLPFPSYCF